jgi:hypothetical protein
MLQCQRQSKHLDRRRRWRRLTAKRLALGFRRDDFSRGFSRRGVKSRRRMCDVDLVDFRHMPDRIALRPILPILQGGGKSSQKHHQQHDRDLNDRSARADPEGAGWHVASQVMLPRHIAIIALIIKVSPAGEPQCFHPTNKIRRSGTGMHSTFGPRS